jgi:hypothetical protein
VRGLVLLAFDCFSRLDVIEVMNEKFEKGMEKLCRWTLKRCTALELEDPERTANAPISKAFHYLRQRPIYLQHCVDELVMQRRIKLVAGFLRSVSSGQSFESGGRDFKQDVPIEDPVRFVSDMLAWIHQSVASENDLLLELFSTHEETRTPRKSSEIISGAIQSHIDKTFDALTNSLKSRVTNVMSYLSTSSRPALGFGSSPALACYQIYSLLVFYQSVFKSLFSSDSSFLQCMDSACRDSSQTLYSIIRAEGDHLVNSIPIPGDDLCATDSIVEYIDQVSEILQTFESSLAMVSEETHESGGSSNLLDLRFFLSALIDPILAAVGEGSRAIKLNSSSTAIFHANVLGLVQLNLKRFEFATIKNETISLELNEWISAFVKDQVHKVLSVSGILEKLKILESRPQESKLCELEGMDSASLKSSIRLFYETLSSSSRSDLKRLVSKSVALFAQCEQLQFQHLRIKARRQIAESIVTCYSSLYQAIQDPSNGYSDLEQLLQYSPENISMLLEAP